MLRILRVFGLLAPVALGLRLLVLPDLEDALGASLELELLKDAVSGLAGAGIACLLAAIWAGFRLNPIADAAGRIAGGDHDVRVPERGGVEGRIGRAVNRLAARLSETHDAATTDRLTGLVNRQALLTELMAEVDRVHRYGRPLSVAFVDIDRFKQINDSHGHHAGDVVLQHVAEALRSNVRSTDIVGRYGGEEFMLVLPETDVQEAAALAEKLRMLIMRSRMTIDDGLVLNVTISIGIAGGTGQQVRLDTIVRDADAAMYSAKNLGRNQTYVFAEPDEDSRIPWAPISAEGRASAVEIGRAARAAAEDLLHSMVAPMPHYRGRPSQLIARVATAMGRQMGLPEAEIERIRVASLLHDVGKVAIPAEILDKPAPLSHSEWQAVVQHPRIGQLILEQASSLRDAVPIILHHHERFGGHGYPYGLRGQDIPLGARIVAIADAYDAMVTDRPYQAAVDHLRALTEIRRHAGTQFDPEVVSVFHDLFATGLVDYVEEAQRLEVVRTARRSSRRRSGAAG